jgi:hypothetical protein
MRSQVFYFNQRALLDSTIRKDNLTYPNPMLSKGTARSGMSLISPIFAEGRAPSSDPEAARCARSGGASAQNPYIRQASDLD